MFAAKVILDDRESNVLVAAFLAKPLNDDGGRNGPFISSIVYLFRFGKDADGTGAVGPVRLILGEDL